MTTQPEARAVIVGVDAPHKHVITRPPPAVVIDGDSQDRTRIRQDPRDTAVR